MSHENSLQTRKLAHRLPSNVGFAKTFCSCLAGHVSSQIIILLGHMSTLVAHPSLILLPKSEIILINDAQRIQNALCRAI